MISSCSNYLPQIAAVEHRLSKSSSWMNSAAPSIQYGSPHFTERQAQVSAKGMYNEEKSIERRSIQLTGTASVDAAGAITGVGTEFLNEVKIGDTVRLVGGASAMISSIAGDLNMQQYGAQPNPVGPVNIFRSSDKVYQVPTERANKSEVCWQPPLGIFKSSKALNGSFELILTPKSSGQFRTSALQSTDRLLNDNGGLLVSTAANVSNGDALAGFNAAFNVESLAFYVAVVDNAAPNAQEQSVVLELEETQVQARRISGGQSTESYQVPRSTFATTWCAQAHNAGSTTLVPPSLFKFGTPTVKAAFNTEQDRLTSYQAVYAGQTRSQPADDVKIVEPAAGVDGTDYTTWSYLQDALSDGGIFDSGGPISKEMDKALGKIHTLQWRVPSGSLATDFQLQTNWDAFDVATTNPNLLLMSHARQIVEWKMRYGQIIGFSSQSA